VVGSRRDGERRGWIRPAPRQKKGGRVFFQPLIFFILFLSLTTRICRFIKSDVYRFSLYLFCYSYNISSILFRLPIFDFRFTFYFSQCIYPTIVISYVVSNKYPYNKWNNEYNKPHYFFNHSISSFQPRFPVKISSVIYIVTFISSATSCCLWLLITISLYTAICFLLVAFIKVFLPSLIMILQGC
jgi:hypothetical protein